MLDLFIPFSTPEKFHLQLRSPPYPCPHLLVAPWSLNTLLTSQGWHQVLPGVDPSPSNCSCRSVSLAFPRAVGVAIGLLVSVGLVAPCLTSGSHHSPTRLLLGVWACVPRLPPLEHSDTRRVGPATASSATGAEAKRFICLSI